jgi:PAS domain S-box-containing protein
MDSLAFQNKRILIVDDSPLEVEFITSILSPLGCQIATAPNGSIALKKLHAYKFDLVLLDIILPDMDGFAIIDKMQKEEGLKDIPTIFISALSYKDQVVTGLSKGAVDYITKPFYPEELIRRINVHLRLKETTEKFIRELEQKIKVENIVNQQDELFRNYFKNSPFIQVISNVESGIIIDVNETFEKELGYSRDEIVGKRSTEIFLSPKQRDKIIREIEKVGFIKNWEISIIDKIGKPHTGILSITRYSSLGKKYLIITGLDTTNLRLLEKEIEHKEQTLNNIALNIPLPFSSANNEGKVEFCNSKFTELFGYSSEDIPTVEDWFKLAYPDPSYRNLVKEQWTKSFTRKIGSPRSAMREYNITCRDGKVRVVEIYSIRNNDNVYNIFKDITAEKEITLQIRKLSEAVYQNPSTIVITNKQGTIEFVNPRFTETTGYTYEEAIGQNPRVLKSGNMPKEFYSTLWATILSGKTWHGEFLNKKKNGELYWEDATIAPILDDNKEIVSFIAIKENITEKKLALEALKKSEIALKEANATKDKFFSIIAHDLRGPIGTISNLAELLTSPSSSINESQRNEFIKAIYQSSNSTFNLLENLLNWAKSQAGNLNINIKPFFVGEAINETIEPLHEQLKSKEISLTTEIEKELKGYGDINLFSTVVRNLVSNAIKFTLAKGKISIKAAIKQTHIEISVIDNGVGIDPTNLKNLFILGPSQSTEGTNNEKGTGMGLLIVKEFVEKNGGEIWVESKPNKGSTFTFSIPKVPFKKPKK